MNLKVNEIFYSLQGEGGRQGEASIFIRLSGCNLKCAFCDTDFEEGKELNVEEIIARIKQYPCRWIIWTGGEPTLQLTDEILTYFKKEGYLQAIESNGTNALSPLLDYTVISPKGNPSYAKKINPEADEIRLPVQAGEPIPEVVTLPRAENYFLSPVFAADPQVTQANIAYCVQYIMLHPEWRLSLQIHKLIGIE